MEAEKVWVEVAHQKYRALFEQAFDAFLLVMINDTPTIVEANAAAAELTGYSMDELHGLSALRLVPPEEMKCYLEALKELQDTGTIRLSDISLLRKDGQGIIVDLSAALLTLDGQQYGLCVIRDITEQKQLREQLEVLVSERTKELEEALEREQHRSSQMATLAQIAAQALEEFDVDAVYRIAARALKENLQIYDAAFFTLDKERNELVLKAHSGAYEQALLEGYRQQVGVGIIGWVAQTGEPALVNDVTKDHRYIQAIPAERVTLSELAVPIKVRGEVIGILDLQSDRKEAFDANDLNMAQAVADQVANALEAVWYFNRVRMFQELNEQIVDSLPDAVVLLNELGRVVAANERFYSDVCHQQKETVLNQHWSDLVPLQLQKSLQASGYVKLEMAIEAALQKEQAFFFPEIPYDNRWWDMRVIPARGAERRRVMLYLRDASMRVRRIYQLQKLVEIAQAMEGTIEPNRLLHAILTAATAGPGLGFNRAILFLLDKSAQVLRVAMAVGALRAEEAYDTWARLAVERKTLLDFLRDYPGDEVIRQTPLMQRVQDLVVSVNDDNLLAACLHRHEVTHIPNPQGEHHIPEQLRQVLSDSEVICVPLVTQDEPLGVIVADNAFSRHPITDESVRLLRLFAASASTALRNAQLISELREALQREQTMREKLVHSEKLAVIGELATKIAHDLRSPLVTIGGYARQIDRSPTDLKRVRRNIQIIVGEVERLERQLRNLLDFATSRKPQMQTVSLSDLVFRLAEVHRPSMEVAGVQLVLDINPDVPPILLDELQIERVILNLWHNAVDAMPDGGTLTVRLWMDEKFVKVGISDTGVGIPPKELSNIFKPFYTTKRNGIGLGLSICKKIVDEHGGHLEVQSEVGKGTVFTISFLIAP